MRVIAGEARGRPLAGPPSTRTRPTTDKVKGAMFSMLETLLVAERPGQPPDQPTATIGDPEVWAGLNVLDLYAGTGALGIEALSRGAAWCDFVEHDARVRAVIDRNLRVTDLGNRARVVGVDASKAIHHGVELRLRTPYGVVVMDPPYDDPDLEAIMFALADGSLLQSGAVVALEHSRRIGAASLYAAPSGSSEMSGLQEVRRRKHGDTEISMYRWHEASRE